MATEEDEYEGHTIPAGAIMTPDVWYDNIESNMYFRWWIFSGPCCMTRILILSLSSLNLNDSWAMGRLWPRLWYELILWSMCLLSLTYWLIFSPGESLAHKSMWLTAAPILATFNFDKPLDDNGNPSRCQESSTLGISGMFINLYAQESVNLTDLDALAILSVEVHNYTPL